MINLALAENKLYPRSTYELRYCQINDPIILRQATKRFGETYRPTSGTISSWKGTIFQISEQQVQELLQLAFYVTRRDEEHLTAMSFRVDKNFKMILAGTSFMADFFKAI